VRCTSDVYHDNVCMSEGPSDRVYQQGPFNRSAYPFYINSIIKHNCFYVASATIMKLSIIYSKEVLVVSVTVICFNVNISSVMLISIYCR